MSTVLIAGSRSINDYDALLGTIQAARIHFQLGEITEIVEGEAPGVDRLAKRYAKERAISYKPFKPDWDNITRPGARIRVNKHGKQYDANAGFIRNEDMVRYTKEREGYCVLLWDGHSPGTLNTRELCCKHNVPFYMAKLPYNSLQEPEKQEPLLSEIYSEQCKIDFTNVEGL